MAAREPQRPSRSLKESGLPTAMDATQPPLRKPCDVWRSTSSSGTPLRRAHSRRTPLRVSAESGRPSRSWKAGAPGDWSTRCAA